jgi:2-phosphosulfolactate phosphatase
VRAVGPGSAVIIVVDVLSSTSAIDICVGNGGAVIPYGWPDGNEVDLARRLNAQLAVRREKTSPENPFSLSPASMTNVKAGTRILLPSPNGGVVAIAAAEIAGAIVMAGSIRNATSVASAAMKKGMPISVIAAGERQQGAPERLRFAVEDLIGAGAIFHAIESADPLVKISPEALAAIAAFRDASADLPQRLMECESGRELMSMGFAEDVRLAAELDVSRAIPQLVDGVFVDARRAAATLS